MTLPTLEKTWEIVPNVLVPSQAASLHAEQALFQVKDAFVNFASNPWVVKASSDGATASASIDDDDKWLTQGDLNWSTGAHSWIVLQRVDGAQLMITLDNSSRARINAQWSPSGSFGGGTTSVDPTATDQIDCMAPTSGFIFWNGNQVAGTPTQDVYHFFHSVDGLCTRVAVCKAGNPYAWWRFETLRNPRAAHTNNPTLAGIYSPSNPATVTGISGWENTGYVKTEKDGTGLETRLLSSSQANGGASFVAKTHAAVAEEWDNELYCVEEHFYCETTGSRGPKGQAFDSWFGQAQIASTGDTYPASPTVREFVQMGPFCWPWTGDATIPQVA